MGKHWKLLLATSYALALIAAVTKEMGILVGALFLVSVLVLDWVTTRNQSFGDSLHVTFFALMLLTLETVAVIYLSPWLAALSFVALTCVGLVVAWRVSSDQYQLEVFFILALALVASQVLAFATLYWQYGLMVGTEEAVKDFELSVYFSLVTWTTLGYGDVQPSVSVRMPAAIEAMLGYFVMGAFLTLAFQKLNSEALKPVDGSPVNDAPAADSSDAP